MISVGKYLTEKNIRTDNKGKKSSKEYLKRITEAIEGIYLGGK